VGKDRFHSSLEVERIKGTEVVEMIFCLDKGKVPSIGDFMILIQEKFNFNFEPSISSLNPLDIEL
jgi:hypothetical protein